MLRTFFIILAIFGFLNLRGQETVPGQLLQHYQQFEQLYGLDQNLVNGVRYIPEYPGSEGHPFFEEGPFSYGALQVGPEVYGNVDMWPLLWKANKETIKRPDDIAVGMTLAIDRAATKEAVDAAIVFSKLRGAESLGPVDTFDQQYLGK